jgi:outer membrane protein assembly factor BamB
MSAFNYGNNPFFEAGIKYPLLSNGDCVIEEGHMLLSGFQVFEGRLFADARTYLVCIDLETKKELWSKKCEKIKIPVVGFDNKIWLYDGSPACYDAEIGSLIWKIQSKEYPMRASARSLFCRDMLNDTSIVICRSLETGAEKWRIKANGSFNKAASEKDIVVIEGMDGLHVCREESGEILWSAKYEEWIKQILDWKSFGPLVFLGPLVNGIFYLGFKGGGVSAINAETGEPIWTNDLNHSDTPHRIIYIQEKIFFSIDQGFGDRNYLTCLDASSGKLLFSSKGNVTPLGCKSLIAANKFIIGGSGAYLSFFDIDKMDYVWRFKHERKEDCFNGAIIASDNYLITCNISLKKIYWFKTNGDL